MNPCRLTIARGMALIAVLAVNAALVRAFVVQEMFIGGILILMVLQLGLLCFFKSRGRQRRFWLGFEVSGMAAVLVLFSCDFLPDSPLNRLLLSYTSFATELAVTNLPTPVSDYLIDEQHDMFLVVVCFVPELIAAILGGMSAACLVPRRPTPARSMNQQAAPSSMG